VTDDQVVDALVERAATVGLVLELVDPPAGPGRRARFYALHLQPTLFGDASVDVVRSWGRIGRRHRPRHICTPHANEPSARASLRPLLAHRLRRGYRL
jgi:predicted DNA-binding WGR domain protein